nr:hypothetical protein [Chlamydiota bacterium]
MSVTTNMSLISSILTNDMTEEMSLNERKKVAGNTLMTNLVKRATRAFLSNNMRAFDGNPGDEACQLQARQLYQLLQSPDVIDEVKKVEQNIKQIDTLCVSDDFLYILRCYLLTVTKIKDRVEENGIIVTKTEFNRISVLSKRINNLFHKEVRAKFV